MNEFKHHKYTWSKPFSCVRHQWELVGNKIAVHFHASAYQDNQWSCGLEIHRTSGEGAPDHLNCWLTGGRCWHDGTSLYAQEALWPMIQTQLDEGNHEEIFNILEYEARKYLREDDHAT